MSTVEPKGVAMHYEYDEYNVLYTSPVVPGEVNEAIGSAEAWAAVERFNEQFAGSSYRPVPVGMQKRRVVKDYGAPELVDFDFKTGRLRSDVGSEQ